MGGTGHEDGHEGGPDSRPHGEARGEAYGEAGTQTRRRRLGGGFRLMTASSLATLAAIAMLPLALGLPGKSDPWAISSIAAGTVNVAFLDAQGAVLAHRGYRQEETVPLAEMPPYLVDAVLAMEDRRFHSHAGVDWWGVMRAAMANAQANRIVEGGSTITQQLARNLYLDASRTFTRKAQEMALAVWLEQRLTKDEILELYLNRIYLGAGAYGVEAAAQVYFGKSVRELSLAEAALIAGLPKAPAQLAPNRDLDAALARAALVLDRLEATGLAAAGDIAAARAEPVALAAQDASGELKAAYFIDWVYSRLPLWIEGDPRELVVETTIDLDLQRLAEEAVEAGLAEDRWRVEIGQAALVALDHEGAVRAMVGGRDYLESQFNRATQAMRHPGSAFKPIVYGAALEAGLSPWSTFVDRPVRYGDWAPSNANDTHLGAMALRAALIRSVNTIAVQVADRIGIERVAAYARRLGLAMPEEAHLAMALGAVEVALVDLTGAYVPFANGGFEGLPHGIVRIRTVDGDILYERARPAPVGLLAPPYRETDTGVALRQAADARPVPVYPRIIARRDAVAMTSMLEGVVAYGTGQRAALEDRPAAGKTGTTNGNRDAAFIGYTAHLVAGVWVGNDDFSQMGRVYGGTVPAEIWAAFMAAAHEGLRARPIHRRFWVGPVTPKEEAPDEAEIAAAEAAEKQAEARATLARALGDLAATLAAAPDLAPPVARTERVRRIDRSVFRNRDYD